MNLFYAPNINGDIYTLPEDESKHCSRVLRLGVSDIIHLIDGVGGFYTAKIVDASPKKCVVAIDEIIREYQKRSSYLHIAVAPTKSIERFEWFLEKATEIGIDEITPIECSHSERKVVKEERLNKVIISAMKQSMKAYLPKLNEMVSCAKFLSKDFLGKKYIAHCIESFENSTKVKSHFRDVFQSKENTLVLIGPEGDFSKEEVELALNSGFEEVSLGPSRLRTETAAIVACSIANVLSS